MKNKWTALLVVIVIVSGLFFLRRNSVLKQVVVDQGTTSTMQPELTEEIFSSLLTLKDIETELLTTTDEFTLNIENTYETALASLPASVEGLDSWYSMTITDPTSGGEILFNVMDHSSMESMEKKLVKLQGSFGVGEIENVVGDRTFGEDVNADTIGSLIIFSNGDKVAVLFTTFIDDEKPLIGFDQVVELSRIVNLRLES